MADCCYLIGNFPTQSLPAGSCIVSISSSSSTEVNKAGDEIIVGPTIGTVTLTGYVQPGIYRGCPGRAGVSIPWLRKYDCYNDQVYFINTGAGRSYRYGESDLISSLVEIPEEVIEYSMFNADAGSGPAALYTVGSQTDGYGFKYSGGPIPFETLDYEGFVHENMGIGDGPWYLQSFNVEASPGNVSKATYSFIFFITPES